MVINSKTKIGKILKENPDALQTIVKISPDFKRLLNPVLRKLVAGRTSISMASKMGKVTPKDFFEALKPLGFEIDQNAVENYEEENEQISMPDYIRSRSHNQIVDFDVRQMIAEGGDPLRTIQQKVKELKQGEVLKIITDFEPVPLIKVLERQKFQSHLNYVDAVTIETYFYNPNFYVSEKTLIDQEEVTPLDDWDVVYKKFQNNRKVIDVRHLEMPEPMMTILNTLETLPNEKALYVNHKKVPIFLLSELKDRGYEYRIKEVQEGEVYLLIFKTN